MPRTTIDRFEQRKLTRSKLVEAALQLFSTSGYEHATVDDISQTAGYSKGAYYFHFSTKDDILLELLRIWIEDRTRVLAEGAEPGAAPRDALHETLANFFSYKEAPQWPGVLLEFWSQAVRSPEVNRRLTQAYAGWRKTLAETFSAVADGGALHVQSAEDAATVVLAAHDGYSVQIAIGSPGGKAMTPTELAASLLTPLETAVASEVRQAAAR